MRKKDPDFFILTVFIGYQGLLKPSDRYNDLLSLCNNFYCCVEGSLLNLDGMVLLFLLWWNTQSTRLLHCCYVQLLWCAWLWLLLRCPFQLLRTLVEELGWFFPLYVVEIEANVDPTAAASVGFLSWDMRSCCTWVCSVIALSMSSCFLSFVVTSFNCCCSF